MPAVIARAAALLAILLLPVASFAAIDAVLEGQPDNSVILRISGAGENFNGSDDGAFGNIGWFNLIPGKPFDTSFTGRAMALETPLPFAAGVKLVSISLDDDRGLVNDDDFALWFDGNFDLDSPFQVDGESVVQGLDFSLLSPGVFTSTNELGLLTLSIVAVPLPPAVLLFAGAGALVLRQRRQPRA